MEHTYCFLPLICFSLFQSLLLGGCAGIRTAGAVHQPIAELSGIPRELCPTVTNDSPQKSATVSLERGWVIIELNQDLGNDDHLNSRLHVRADHPAQEPIDLGCGRSVVLESARDSRGNAAVEPNRIIAQVDEKQLQVTASPITLVDSHEDWDGGSGGTLVTAQIKAGRVRVVSVRVSKAGSGERHDTKVVEFDLAGFFREEVQTEGGPVVLRAEP